MTIAKSTGKIIDQLIAVMEQLTPGEYVKPLGIYNGATIGKHFRHIHDFYACLLKGSGCGCIDYCHRDRIELLETDSSVLIQCLEKIKEEVPQLDTEEILEVYGDFEFDNGERPISKSSVGRELLYAYDHAVHHLAIIKLGIRAEFKHIDINNDVGVAASTLRHQNSYS